MGAALRTSSKDDTQDSNKPATGRTFSAIVGLATANRFLSRASGAAFSHAIRVGPRLLHRFDLSPFVEKVSFILTCSAVANKSDLAFSLSFFNVKKKIPPLSLFLLLSTQEQLFWEAAAEPREKMVNCLPKPPRSHAEISTHATHSPPPPSCPPVT